MKGRKKYPDDDAFISELATWLISGQGNTFELSINDSTPLAEKVAHYAVFI